MATTLLCGLSMFACAIPLFFYTFTEKRQVEAVARVLARKKAAGTMTETEEGEFLNALKAIDPKHADEVYAQIFEILGIEDLSELGETYTFSEDADGNVEETVTVDAIEISELDKDNIKSDEKSVDDEGADGKKE